jgi:tRNA pseudouridine38-40 synthase
LTINYRLYFMRYKLTIEYDGTDYHGWQVQPNGRTIQAVLQGALTQMTGESAAVVAAGRTDAGVHACGQTISFALQRALPAEMLQRGLNALTPPDLCVTAAAVAGDDFDPRRAARSRLYHTNAIHQEFLPNEYAGMSGDLTGLQIE